MNSENRPGLDIILDPSEWTKPDIVDLWKNAEPEWIDYKGGWVKPHDSKGYKFRAGKRLVINGEQVMDTCEAPWAYELVDRVFEMMRHRRGKLKVLERGAGLNISGTRVIHEMIKRGGGEYYVIELNRGVYERTLQWRKRHLAYLKEIRQNQGIKIPLKIEVLLGEAREISRKLIQEDGMRFNAIISDTYPLSPLETGINDISDVDILKSGLKTGGVFGFFAYFPDSYPEEIKIRQQRLMSDNFKQALFSVGRVNPPPSYRYLWSSSGIPVRSLEVQVRFDPYYSLSRSMH